MVRYRKRSIAETISAVVINWLCEKPAGDGVREGRGGEREAGNERRRWGDDMEGWQMWGVAPIWICCDWFGLVTDGKICGGFESLIPELGGSWRWSRFSIVPPRSHPSLVSLILFSCVSFSFPFSPCQLSSLSPFFPNRLSFQFSCPLFLIFYFFPPRADISPPFTSISSEIFPSLHFLSSPPLLHSSTSSPAP